MAPQLEHKMAAKGGGGGGGGSGGGGARARHGRRAVEWRLGWAGLGWTGCLVGASTQLAAARPPAAAATSASHVPARTCHVRAVARSGPLACLPPRPPPRLKCSSQPARAAWNVEPRLQLSLRALRQPSPPAAPAAARLRCRSAQAAATERGRFRPARTGGGSGSHGTDRPDGPTTPAAPGNPPRAPPTQTRPHPVPPDSSAPPPRSSSTTTTTRAQ